MNWIWKEQKSWHKVSICSVQLLWSQGRRVALFRIKLFLLYEMHQDDTSRALTWFRTQPHTCSSKYKQICNLSHWQPLEGKQVKAGAGACLQPGSGLPNSQGWRKCYSRQDICHCNLEVTITFYLTREISLLALLSLLLFLTMCLACSCCWACTQLLECSRYSWFVYVKVVKVATFGESLSKGKLSAALQNTKLNL